MKILAIETSCDETAVAVAAISKSKFQISNLKFELWHLDFLVTLHEVRGLVAVALGVLRFAQDGSRADAIRSPFLPEDAEVS